MFVAYVYISAHMEENNSNPLCHRAVGIRKTSRDFSLEVK